MGIRDLTDNRQATEPSSVHAEAQTARTHGAATDIRAPFAISDASNLGDTLTLHCDVVVVGGGPAGLSVAQGLSGSRRDVLILESGGVDEHPATEELNEVLAEPGTWSPEQVGRREFLHTPQLKFWEHSRQGYGVRCRALGGSTAAWAGKSAAFDAIDFAQRPWVPNSGWPIDLASLETHLDQAAAALNLGVNCYDDELWTLMHRNPPRPSPDPAVLRSFFWQISRSSISSMDVMRSGAEFLKQAPDGCRVLTHATVTEILTDADGRRATGVVMVDAAGVRRTVHARTVVLAASAIENARLLLVSRSRSSRGVGNAHDTVGRFLMDHPGADIARFDPSVVNRMSHEFGFFGVNSDAGVKLYWRGLAPSAATQESEELLNSAIFMVGERAPDNPWTAAKRIAGGHSESYLSDVLAILKSPALVAKGLARLAFQSEKFPKVLSRGLVDQLVRFFPNLAVEEYLSHGVPLKLIGLTVQAICEQVPDRDNRIFLSDRTDRFGVPLPAASWSIGERETRTMMRLAHIMQQEFGKAGMPVPVLEDWVARSDARHHAITDMGHTSGTTRMSADPKQGVVDANCKVHGVDGLYVAGSSIFATSGHANPTLMIVAFARRLADHLKQGPLQH